jgi:hypothetical protein
MGPGSLGFIFPVIKINRIQSTVSHKFSSTYFPCTNSSEMIMPKTDSNTCETALRRISFQGGKKGKSAGRAKPIIMMKSVLISEPNETSDSQSVFDYSYHKSWLIAHGLISAQMSRQCIHTYIIPVLLAHLNYLFTIPRADI